MKSFIKNASSSFIRIARIQINSTLKNKNLYPDHYYKFECKLDEIYRPQANGNLDLKLECYLSDDLYFYTNTSNFYYQLTTSGDNKYIDIGLSVPNNYTNIHVNLDTVDEGSVTLYREDAVIGNYTRINFLSNYTGILCNGFSNFWIGANGSVKIRVAKNRACKVTNVNTGTVGVLLGSDTYNNNNTYFTLSTENITDYSVDLTIGAKSNGTYLVEVL